MAAKNSAIELLFGILALKNDLITSSQFVAAFDAWVREKSESVSEILVRQGSLSPQQALALAAMLEVHLQKFGGEPDRSLAMISSLNVPLDVLRRLPDIDLQESLSRIPEERISREVDEYATIRPQLAGASPGVRFRILRLHAEGGLGRVSVARDEEVNREVALKEIKLAHADNPDSRARFLREAEITGRLEHPGIVPVYGLGQYPDGRPFYAMRLIKGDSLKEAIEDFHRLRRSSSREHSLEFRKLLQRFIDVCNAVEYAHSRGVLHRDLKPGNIMLGKYGETLVVDWGLAKPLEGDVSGQRIGARPEGEVETAFLGEEPLLTPESDLSSAPTQMGTLVGTLPFMSPEQAAGRLDLLGPSSDVYSLGATLYSLLCGQLPFTGSDQPKVLQQVERGEFPRPCAVDSKIPPALEAICLKAMAVRREDRYSSAELLAEDVEHWLGDEQVVAYPESLLGHASRWVRKNPGMVSSLGMAVLAGVASLAVILLVVSNTNRKLALANGTIDAKNSALTEANGALTLAQLQTEQKRGEAERARSRAEKLTNYLTAAFRSADPFENSHSITVVEILNRASDSVATDLKDDPETAVAMYEALGKAFLGLHAADEGIQNYVLALEQARRTFGNDKSRLAVLSCDLARNYVLAGKYERAIPLFEENLPVLKSDPEFSEETYSEFTAGLATAYEWTQQYDKAIPLRRTRAAWCKNHYPKDSLIAMKARLNLQNVERNSGSAITETTTEIVDGFLSTHDFRSLDDSTESFKFLNSLAFAYSEVKQFQLAIAVSEEAIKRMTRRLTADHPDTLNEMFNLAGFYEKDGQIDKAIEWAEKAQQGECAKLSAGHQYCMGAKWQVAKLYAKAQRFADAAKVFEDILATWKPTRNDQERFLWEVRLDYGKTLVGLNRNSDAERELVSGYRGLKAAQVSIPAHLRAATLRKRCQEVLAFFKDQGRSEQVLEWERELQTLPVATDD